MALNVNFDALIQMQTLQPKTRAALAEANALAETAEANSLMAQYQAKKAKSLLGDFDIEAATERRWKLINYLSSYGHDAEGLKRKSMKQLEDLLTVCDVQSDEDE